MDQLFELDWARLFVLDTPILEIVLRGTIMYLALFVLLRVLRREAGTVGMSDLLVLVLIADAAQNGMAGSYTSITDGLLLCGVIIGWSYGLEWLGARSPRIERLIYPGPIPLIRNGKVLHRNMRRQLITMDELTSHLRTEGVTEIADVRLAALEGDGQISVVTAGPRRRTPRRRGV